MRQTRKQVLQALYELGEATVNDLADLVGVKPVSVRHHLNTLHADGLILLEERRQPVGRPYHVYRLSARGLQTVPRHYSQMVEVLLGEVQGVLDAQEREALAHRLATLLARRAGQDFDELPVEARMERLARLMNESNYNVRWQQAHQQLQLDSTSCPYYHAGSAVPEACHIEERMFQALVGVDVQRESCIQAGDPVCRLALG